MLDLRLLSFRTGDILQPLGDYGRYPANRAGLPNRLKSRRGMLMPDIPAQQLLSATKLPAEAQTERMATPEELYALSRIAEVENAIAEFARNEQISEKRASEKQAAQEQTVVVSVAGAVPAPVTTLDALAASSAETGTPSLFPELASTIQAQRANAENPELDGQEHNVAVVESSSSSTSQGGWLLELAAILDQHRIWVETGGEGGTKADLCGANLENADLTGVNLQGAFLQRANLRGADLSMANLRHASLVQADLCNANLLGTELRGANLMGATLYGVDGLWLGRLGGANLYDAMLPETISSIDGSKAVWAATRSARSVYSLMPTTCSLCVLCVATTSDPRLILDGQTIPIARLGNILPINAFYLIAPIFLVVMFVRFQFLLLRIWSSMAALPAVFPDGQTVEQGGPWYLMGVVRRHFRWLRGTKTPVSWLGNAIATLLAYWAVPATIAALWMRYLVRQDMRGTALHVLFFVLSVSVATGLPSVVSRVIRSGEVRRHSPRSVARLAFLTLRAPIAFGLVLFLLSCGVILGISADSDSSR